MNPSVSHASCVFNGFHSRISSRESSIHSTRVSDVEHNPQNRLDNKRGEVKGITCTFSVECQVQCYAQEIANNKMGVS